MVRNKAKGANSSGRRFKRKKILQELAALDTLKKTLAKKRDDVKRRKTGAYTTLPDASLTSPQSKRPRPSTLWTASSSSRILSRCRQTAPNAPLSGMAAPPENTVIIVDVGPTMARPSAVSGFVC